MEINYNYPNIIRVKEIKNEHETNKYLELGWVLLNVCKVDFGHPTREDYTTTYVVGWNKENGEVKECDKWA